MPSMPILRENLRWSPFQHFSSGSSVKKEESSISEQLKSGEAYSNSWRETRVIEGWIMKKIMRRVAVNLLQTTLNLCRYLMAQNKKAEIAIPRGRKK